MSQSGTGADYSRHAGVSREAVRKALRDGRITARADGRIDFEQADREWAKNTDPRKPSNRTTGNPKGARGNGKASATSGMAASQARKADAQASMEELKLAEMRGELGKMVEIEKAVFENNRRARDRLRMVVARMGGMISPEAREMLRKEIREVCDELGVIDGDGT